jgi:hypothetical protein
MSHVDFDIHWLNSKTNWFMMGAPKTMSKKAKWKEVNDEQRTERQTEERYGSEALRTGPHGAAGI